MTSQAVEIDWSNEPSFLPVAWKEAVLALQLSDGRAMLVQMGHQPVRQLNPNWKPDRVCVAFAPTLILELVNEHGHRTPWFLGEDLAFLTNSIDGLDQVRRAALKSQTESALRQALCRLFMNTNVAVEQATRAIFALSAPIRSILVQLAQEVVGFVLGKVRPMELITQHIERTFDAVLPDPNPAFMEPSVPSPIHGWPMHRDLVIHFQNGSSAHRFVDHGTGQVLFILEQVTNVPGRAVWLPAERIAATNSSRVPNSFTQGLDAYMFNEIALDVLRTVDARYLADGPANVMRPVRIRDILASGDKVRMQATGISEIIDVLPAGRYHRLAPRIIEAFHPDSAPAPFWRFATETEQEYPASFLTVLHDAAIWWQGVVVTHDGTILSESGLGMLGEARLPKGVWGDMLTGFRFADETPRRYVPGTTLSMMRPWFRNFGHWLTDIAAPLALLAAQGKLMQTRILVGAQADRMQSIMRETLSQLVPNMEIIEHPDDELWRFETLHMLTPFRETFKIPAGLVALRSALMSRDNGPPRRHIYISRRSYSRAQDAKGRRIVNEDEVLALCRRLDFELVEPETMTLAEQVALFQQARIVMGPKGAGLTSLVFCQPGALAVVLAAPDWPDPFFWDISGQLGCRYVEFVGRLVSSGRQPGSNAIEVAVDQLEKLLKRELA